MDPNEALAYIRDICQQFNKNATYADMDELVEQFQALDEWLANGGFKPNAWCYSMADAIQKGV